MGGLASQLHKYAVGRALSIRYGQELKLDLSWFESTPPGDTPRQLVLNRFHTTFEIASGKEISTLKGSRWRNALARRVKNLFDIDLSKRTRFAGDRLGQLARDASRTISLKDGAYVDGELVGDAVFLGIRSILMSELTLRKECISDEMRTIAERMQLGNSVAFHIRRGDFLTNPNASSYHAACGLEYFSKAANLMRDKYGNNISSVYLFSDDLDWLRLNKDNFPDGAEIIHSLADEQSFFLLCQCKNFVISNSGFSWLAAWMGHSENSIVIAPKVWLKDEDANRIHLNSLMFKGMVIVDNE